MNKTQYEEHFRDQPAEIINALSAAKKIIGELAAHSHLTEGEYIRWSTILNQMEKAHSIVAVSLPGILKR